MINERRKDGRTARRRMKDEEEHPEDKEEG